MDKKEKIKLISKTFASFLVSVFLAVILFSFFSDEIDLTVILDETGGANDTVSSGPGSGGTGSGSGNGAEDGKGGGNDSGTGKGQTDTGEGSDDEDSDGGEVVDGSEPAPGGNEEAEDGDQGPKNDGGVEENVEDGKPSSETEDDTDQDKQREQPSEEDETETATEELEIDAEPDFDPSAIQIGKKRSDKDRKKRGKRGVRTRSSKKSVGNFNGNYKRRGQRGKGRSAREKGATDASENAVDLGLAWLAKVQNKDGHWNVKGEIAVSANISIVQRNKTTQKTSKKRLGGIGGLGRSKGLGGGVGGIGNRREKTRTKKEKVDTGFTLVSCTDVGATGLAVLAFLGAGHTHKNRKSIYRGNVKRALNWLLNRLGENGGFSQQTYYEQGIGTMAICEAYGMTRDKVLRRPAQKALDHIVVNIGPNGGYGYGGPGDDTHVTSFQVMALKSGILAGLIVPKDITQKLLDYYNRALRANGTTSYRSVGGNTTPVRTAVGLFCRMFLKVSPKDPNAIKIANVLDKSGPIINNVFHVYDGTYGMFQMGGDYWKNWNSRFRDPVIALQTKNGEKKGCWQGGSGDVVNTALYIMALEVYYRYLPVNQ